MDRQEEASESGKRLLRKAEAAKYLTISTRTLTALAAANRITVVQVSPHRVAFDRADLDRYIAQQRR